MTKQDYVLSVARACVAGRAVDDPSVEDRRKFAAHAKAQAEDLADLFEWAPVATHHAAHDADDPAHALRSYPPEPLLGRKTESMRPAKH